MILKLKAVSLLTVLIFLTPFTMAQGMLGKRFSAGLSYGIKPNLRYIYPIAYESFKSGGYEDVIYYEENENLLASSFRSSLQINANYVLNRNTEVSLSILGTRNLFYSGYGEDNYIYSESLKNIVVRYDFVPYVVYFRNRVYDLSFKFYTGLNGEMAPSGIFYKIGLGFTAIKASFAQQEYYDGIKITSAYNELTGNRYVLTQSEHKIVKDEIVEDVDFDDLATRAFHVSYGFGYQRFYSNKIYTSVGIDGSLPIGIVINQDYAPVNGPDASRPLQQNVVSKSLMTNFLRFNVGIGFMIY